MTEGTRQSPGLTLCEPRFQLCRVDMEMKVTGPCPGGLFRDHVVQCVSGGPATRLAYSRHPAKLTDASKAGGASTWQARSLSDVSEAHDWDGKLEGWRGGGRFP